MHAECSKIFNDNILDDSNSLCTVHNHPKEIF